MGIKPSHTRPFLATASGPSPRSVAANPGMREIDMYVFGLLHSCGSQGRVRTGSGGEATIFARRLTQKWRAKLWISTDAHC